jgi:hypothetical protein
MIEWDDYVTDTINSSEEAKKLAKILISWEKHKQHLFPNDVLNFMIDLKMITDHEVIQMKKEPPIQIQLPGNHDI